MRFMVSNSISQVRTQVFTFLVILCVFILIATFIWGYFDQRTLDGVGVWVKPAKFSLSFLVHCATLAIIVSTLSEQNAKLRIIRGVGWVLSFLFFFEITYITYQAVQGQHSHFNTTTAFHSTMYSLMGAGAILLIALPLVIAWRAKQDIAYGLATQSGIWWGAITSFVLTLVIGGYLGSNGSHFVGKQTDPNLVLPFLGWSTEVGDLRPAHFMSLHSLQFLPLVGLWADRTGRGIITIWIAVFTYSVLTVALFMQALLGQPLIRI